MRKRAAFSTGDDERGNRMMQVKRAAECWREPNTQGDTDKMEDARCPPDKTDGLKTKGSISTILKCIAGDINLIRM